MFDWVDYLRFATSLAQANDPSEAEMRSAISRAYYAAFNVTRTYLILVRRITPINQPHIHVAVWGVLRDSPSPVERRIAQVGFRLLSFRRRAGYDAEYLRIAYGLRQAIRDTERLIDAIAGLSQTNSDF